MVVLEQSPSFHEINSKDLTLRRQLELNVLFRGYESITKVVVAVVITSEDFPSSLTKKITVDTKRTSIFQTSKSLIYSPTF